MEEIIVYVKSIGEESKKFQIVKEVPLVEAKLYSYYAVRADHIWYIAVKRD